MALAATRVLHNRLTPFWAKVNRHIHVHALQLVFQQWERRHEKSPCTETFTKTTGLPCRHTIVKLIESSVILTKTDFHVHWWIDRTGNNMSETITILPPKSMKDLRAERAVVKWHRKGTGTHGNRRIPLQFEHKPPGTKNTQPIVKQATILVASPELEQGLNSYKPSSNLTHRQQEERKVRGRIGKHWGTIVGHQIVDDIFWFDVLWDKVGVGEANPTPQTEADFADVGMLSMVKQYKRARNV